MSNSIQQIVSDDFDALNQNVVKQLHSEVPLIENIGQYLIDAGGKRIRPLLVLLCSRALNYQGNQHINLATVIEFLHTATLLHDDVVDMSEMRRGQPTANVQWGNPSSVLVGDFIYSRAFQLLVNIADMQIMEVMATTTNKISEGEVLQLVNQHNVSATELDYMKVIHNKTAILFAAACSAAAILANADATVQEKLHTFGLEVGMAFQLIDDVLDYDGDSKKLGKNIGDDLAEGKPTLPLIYVMKNGNAEQKRLISSAIKEGGLEHLDEIINIVRESGALEYTQKKAEERIAIAKDCLTVVPASPYKEGLELIAQSAVKRSK
ncbi:MAG: octaprenyl diphosphate synthase [SAR86 cluster bacterium]|uniref:Octaprenyl diphosphate synthase n=1 Tax=SAR86 cluster bacterium TaxID=2030880 RepID=A0A2A5CGE8_9GAMM|nr:polyprenyl synthetase family protein [Gammaproteobacteria bacterium AH-315-E17]PCJ42608.1 MAG: octaprenyl diphosphate synthase [SAR86 cluster bacterium]